MKKLIALLTTAFIITSAQSQTLVVTASTASNINAGGGTRSWNIVGSTATASNLNNGNDKTDYLFIRGFNFSSLPANISVTGITVNVVNRTAGSTVVDSAVRVVLAGQVFYGATSTATNAAATPTTWPSTALPWVYTFGSSAYSSLTRADLVNANFGIAISARRTSGNISASMGTSVTLTLSYVTLAPLILTDFTILKNADNHVEIRFATSSEEDVKEIYIERSSDGRNFSKLFTIQPRGARNVYTKYNMVDKTPMQGNNYYRIAEIDKNGRWYYYTTKQVNISERGEAFAAYYNGGQVVANISSIPGQYEISLVDMSGITISRKKVTLNNGAGQVALDAPSRTGIYLALIKSEGLNQALRVAVTR